MALANWSTSEQIRTHKLASSIINGHGDAEYEILDGNELVLLQRFVTDPTSCDAIMKETGWDDGSKKHSLVGFLARLHATEIPPFDDRDMEMLKEWVDCGMPKGQSVVR